MITEQQIFDIAEWIAYNFEALNKKMHDLQEDHHYEKFLYFEVISAFASRLTVEDVKIAFEDEKLTEVINWYFNHTPEGEEYEKNSLH